MLSTASQPSRQRTHSCRVRLSLRMNTAVPGAASGYRSFSCRSAERRGGRQVARRTVSPVAFHLVLKGGQSHTILWVFQFRSVNKKVFFTRYPTGTRLRICSNPYPFQAPNLSKKRIRIPDATLYKTTKLKQF